VLVAAGGPEAFAGAVAGLLADEPKRRAFVVAARDRVEREFSLDAMVRNTCAVYTGGGT
jgi:glycosyltransferase involved in cell wall biosynthesis